MWPPHVRFDSSHPDPNGLRQELRVVLSSTPVASAVHLVAGMAKSTLAAVSDLAGVMSPVGFDLSDLGFDPPRVTDAWALSARWLD